MKYNQIIVGDCWRELRKLPAGIVQTCITSPPYYNLRDYKVDGQIGLEKTPEKYIDALVDVFYEVKRVLRPDGTIWVNLGDSYQDKNLMGMPWKLAFALQADGWCLRQEIIWSKPNPMPETVHDRCCKSHEHIFLLSKSPSYFYDRVAVLERSADKNENHRTIPHGHSVTWRKSKEGKMYTGRVDAESRKKKIYGCPEEGRNKRSVWTIPIFSSKEKHFATFPPRLVMNCIRAGTSEKGCCPECGSPWQRTVDRERVATRPGLDTKIEGRDRKEVGNRDPGRHVTTVRTTGWEPNCRCRDAKPVPCLVLDPFVGSGTTCLVAKKLHRRWLGLELNPQYAEMARKRIDRVDEGLFST